MTCIFVSKCSCDRENIALYAQNLAYPKLVKYYYLNNREMNSDCRFSFPVLEMERMAICMLGESLTAELYS